MTSVTGISRGGQVGGPECEGVLWSGASPVGEAGSQMTLQWFASEMISSERGNDCM